MLNRNGPRICNDDLALFDFNMNLFAAMSAGVFDRNFFVAVFFAVDQQQEIYRSPHVKRLFSDNGNGMEVVPHGTTPSFVMFGKHVARLSPGLNQ